MSVVLPGKRPVKGTAITQLVIHVSYTVGYGPGGVVVAFSGLSVVLVGNAATFLVSAVVILRGVVARPATAVVGSASALVGAGVRFVLGHARLRIVILFGCCRCSSRRSLPGTWRSCRSSAACRSCSSRSCPGLLSPSR